RRIKSPTCMTTPDRTSVCAKDALRGHRFAEDDELKHSVREQLRSFSKEFYATGIRRLTQRYNNVL
ncbi:hypothetical protein Cfor_06046, partial [Coptotermes formosanus]